MSDSSKPDKESARQKDHKEISGYVYGGSIITGMGIGFATNSLLAGIFIGLGAALLIVALLHYKWRH
ncbi:hypothetical protein ACFLTJ_00110 [Chloroflexota bacterium]